MEKKDGDFEPDCKKSLVWFVLNEIEAKLFCHCCVNFPNSKNENSSCRKGNKNFQADGRRANNICSGHQGVLQLRQPKLAAQQPRGGHMGMCHCEGYGFQAVYSSIGYINQSVWV